jgi:hypothetical protein
LVASDEDRSRLEEHDPDVAQFMELRHFAGLAHHAVLVRK